MAACDALEAKNVTLERFVYELRDKGLLQKDDPDFITNEEAEFRLNCDTQRWLTRMKRQEDQQEAEPVEGVPKIPGGFVGFCYRKICDLPTEAREVFLLTNKGDSSCYKYREDWLKEFGKTLSRPGDMISKAKNLYRKLN